ncbi:MAG TPA: mandelate racemase/muconate lactonizing enzyme family protein [Methylomirabilota bacterium]
MKITRVETIVVKVPYRHGGPPTGFGGRVWTTLDTLLVRVETDDGLTGWGEAFGYNVIPATKAAIDELIAPLVVGRDAGAIADLSLYLQRTLHNFGRGGPAIYGVSGIDIALWDIAGKAAKRPLHRLLGHAGRDAIPAYASLMRYGDPALVGRKTAEAVERGYRHVKLHEREVPAVRAAREAAGADVAIMLDTNCPWTVTEAVAMARALTPYDLHWLEEPVWPPEDYGGLAEVRRATRIPIAAGENAGSVTDLAHMMDARAVTYVQPSATKIGGVSAMNAVLALATSREVAVVPHAPYFGPGLLATLHVLAAAPAATLFERLYVDLDASLFGDLVDAVDGRMRIPSGPGLGADPDPDVVTRFRAT